MPCPTLLRPAVIVLASGLFLAGCVTPTRSTKGTESFLAEAPMGWETHAEGERFTLEALEAVTEKDAELASRVPQDIERWCPEYESASIEERRAFWVGLMSAVAKYESRWTPEVVGGGGRYIGLMQISPVTARGSGCDATTAAELKDGGDNLACAVQIFAGKVADDGLVAGSGNRGLGRDWGPFRKRAVLDKMAAWTSEQPYCNAG